MRSRLLCAGTALALLPDLAAAAGETAVPPLEIVEVTATRVSRSGYESSTPTTVLGEETLTLRAPQTLADALALLPQMRNAADEGTGSLVFGGSAGRGMANLRGLGTNRTLVLLDGERPVSNSLSSDRDITALPAALISRVDVVTGGASASYGSDAVAGVVNFRIDSRFTGFKASAEGGLSADSDVGAGKFTAAWGGDLGERMHLVVSGEYFDRSGLDPGSRSFATVPAIVPNPGAANGERPLRVVRNAYDADQSLGGLILNGPLTGQQFLADGSIASYVPGSCTVSQPYILCDTPRQDLAATLGTISLTSPQKRAAGFARLTYEITPDIEARFDVLVSRNDTSLTSIPLETSEFGLQLGINVAENPYLPDAVRNQYLAAGEPTLFLGRQNTDEGVFRDVFRESVEGLSASLRARLGETWVLKAHASYGQSDTGERWQNAYSIDRFFNAVDVVSVGGTPTCRINAVTVTDPACAPADIFGSGNMSDAAKAYFLGDIIKPLKTWQSEFAIDFTAEPFALPTGPVSIAFGASYREENARQFNDGVGGGFAFTGYPPFEGETRVTEAYAQAVVPLLKDQAFAKSVELELGARWVDYSQSGSEVPWKAGLNWIPVGGLRFRVSASEDIRAPNVLELDLPQFESSISYQVNPLPNGLPVFNALGFAPGDTVNVREIGGGNPDLTPEVARTTAVGVVLQPEKLAGFSASLDYFHIKIDDAITTLPASAIVGNCAAGDQAQCDLIRMPAGSALPLIETISVNAQSFLASGFDGEVSYSFKLGGGDATIRALANYLREYEQIVPGSPTQDLRGDNRLGFPSLQGDLSVAYAWGGTTTLLSGTYIGSGSFNNALSADIQNNHVPHVWYIDANVEHRFRFGGSDCAAFAGVDNLFDEQPPHPGFGIYTNIDSSLFTGIPYDRVGRYFKAGLRVAF